MSDPRRGIHIGPHWLPWGTLLGDAARLLGVDPSSTPGAVTVACPAAYGLRTVSARLSAPAFDRPVTAVDFELAPPGNPPYAPDVWADPLRAFLGEPESLEYREIPGCADPGDAVAFSARWTSGDENDVWLSIYGGPRDVPGGRSAGTLSLTWSEELAARPYIDEWRLRNEALARAASGSISIERYSVEFPQSAIYAACRASENPAAIEAWRRKRHALLSLHQPDVLDTPHVIARTLTHRQFAIWSCERDGIWCLSTPWDSVAVRFGTPATIDRVELKTAKGPGYSELSRGMWAVRDAESSREIAAAARRLGAIPGVTIREMGGYNC